MEELYLNHFGEDSVIEEFKVIVDDLIYSYIENKQYMRNIQLNNGTFSVCNIPPFDFFIKRQVVENNILYVIYSDNTSEKCLIMSNIISGYLVKKYSFCMYLKEEDFMININSNIPDENSLIILIEPDVSTVFFIVSTGVPVFICTDEDNLFSDNMINYGLSKIISYESEYKSLKNDFGSFYKRRKDMIKKVNNIKKSLNNKLNLIDSLYVEVQEEINNELCICVSSFIPKTKYKNICYENFILSFKEYSSSNGIYFELNIVNRFIKQGNVLYYPWIGIIEVSNKEDIKDMINSDTFKTSITHCYGIFVLDSNTYETLRKLIKFYKLNIYIDLFNIPKLDFGIKFNLDTFQESPIVVNFGRSGMEFLSLPIYDNSIDLDINLDIMESEYYYENCIIVLTADYPYFFGVLYNCICFETPIILRRDEYIENILGHDYPLFTDDRLKKHELISFLNEEKIELALSILKDIETTTIERFIEIFKEKKVYRECEKYSIEF